MTYLTFSFVVKQVTFILALIVAVAVAMPQRPFRPRPGGFQQPGFGGFGGFNNFGKIHHSESIFV
jgi:hypothetical protein